ncbi:MAG: HNH endonuclease [Pirellulales bacterium]|nr:HNH endonuclease [Pirellulales bacterium]
MPRRPLRVCAHPGCPALTPRRYCAAHERLPAAREPDRRPSAARRGYGGDRWRSLRLAVFRRDHWICRACGKACASGRLAAPADRAHCDHVVPKEQGGTDEIDNLQTLCGSCHSRKTDRAEGGFGRPPRPAISREIPRRLPPEGG